MRTISIVGCLPEPLGGISIFCHRLLYSLDVQYQKVRFYDCYSGKKHHSEFSDNIKVVEMLKVKKNRFSMLLSLIKELRFDESDAVFFNFSTCRSIVFLCIVLAFVRKKKIMICLHHGHLVTDNKFQRILCRLLFPRVDLVFSLSPRQTEFYKAYIRKEKIIESSSYIKPEIKLENIKTENEFNNDEVLNILLAGNSQSHYNVEETLMNTIEHLGSIRDRTFSITVSIYGDTDEYINNLRSCLIEMENVTINFTSNLSSDEFMSLLSRQDLYIRNTAIDSFGIIVADAINLGVDVIASNVCPRYNGCYVFDYKNSISFIEALSKYLDGKHSELEREYTKISDFPISKLF